MTGAPTVILGAPIPTGEFTNNLRAASACSGAHIIAYCPATICDIDVKSFRERDKAYDNTENNSPKPAPNAIAINEIPVATPAPPNKDNNNPTKSPNQPPLIAPAIATLPYDNRPVTRSMDCRLVPKIVKCSTGKCSEFKYWIACCAVL